MTQCIKLHVKKKGRNLNEKEKLKLMQKEKFKWMLFKSFFFQNVIHSIMMLCIMLINWNNKFSRYQENIKIVSKTPSQTPSQRSSLFRIIFDRHRQIWTSVAHLEAPTDSRYNLDHVDVYCRRTKKRHSAQNRDNWIVKLERFQRS